MPRGDGTGPLGLGSRSGRGLGNCQPVGMESCLFFMNRGFGNGYGRGWRMGRARGCFNGQGRVVDPVFGSSRVSNTADKQTLQKRAEILQVELDQIKQQLAKIESAKVPG